LGSGSDGVPQRFPGLLALDLSFTRIIDLSGAVAALAGMSKLRQFCLAGSPASLLPHARLRLLRGLPELQLIDGSAVEEAEAADAQKLRFVEAERPASVRLQVQPMKFERARTLLSIAARDILAKREATADEEAEAAEPMDEILQACMKGVLRFRFELPDGTWAETQELNLTQELVGDVDGGKEPFDSFDLSALKTPSGDPLLFDVDVEATTEEDRLLRLNQWLRRGMGLKVFFRERLPPTPEELAAEAEAAADPKKKGKSTTPPAPASDEGEQEVPAEPPEEVAIGGVVVPFENLLWRQAETSVTADVREAGELPDLPAPWVETPEVRVVPIARWLEPNTQVPKASRLLTQEWGPPGKPEFSELSLRVVLYAEEPVEEEVQEEEIVPEPKGKPKGK